VQSRSIEGIWVTGKDEFRDLRASDPAETRQWFPVPTTVIVRSARAERAMAKVIEGLPPKIAATVRVVAAETQPAVQQAVLRALHRSSADFIHLRHCPIAYDVFSFALLAEWAGRTLPAVMSFDLTYSHNNAHFLQAAGYCRRHNMSVAGLTSGVSQRLEEHLIARNLLLRASTEVMTLPPGPDWAQLLLPVLARMAGQIEHVPLLVGTARRTRAKFAADPERTGLILPFLEREWGGALLDDDAWLAPGGATLLDVFVTNLNGIALARQFSPQISSFVRFRLAQRLETLWPSARSLAGSDVATRVALLCDIADSQDLQIFDHTEYTLAEADTLLTSRLKEEAILLADAPFGRILAHIVDGAPALVSEKGMDSMLPQTVAEQRALLRLLRAYREQATMWRADAAQQVQLLALEKRKSADLLRIANASRAKPAAEAATAAPAEPAPAAPRMPAAAKGRPPARTPPKRDMPKTGNAT
jgi:hypothetical protein